jgi:hypothetical protein
MNRWRAFAGLMALVTLGVIGNPRLAQEPRRAAAREAAGYEALVSELAGAGLLRARNRPAASGQRVTFAPLPDDAESLGKKACDPACPALLEQFARNSFLALDMLDANAAFWRRDGAAVIGMVPGSHAAPGVSARLAAWREDVLYRGGRAYPRLNLVAADGTGPVRQFGGTRTCPFDDSCGSGPLVRAGAFQVEDDSGRVISLRRLGDGVLVVTPHTLSGLAATIDGRALTPPAAGDRRSDARGQFILAPGQTFGIAGKGFERSFQLVMEPGTLASEGPRGRLRNPHLAAPMRALEAAAPAGPVESSVDAAMQQALELALADTSRITGDRAIPMRSGAVLMDALTGEVRALATYPLAPADLPEAMRETNTGRALLAENNTLTPLAVGSTAKVPFAAAIADRWPGLVEYTLPCEPGRFGSVLGREMRGLSGRRVTLNDHCEGADTSFRDFIAFSSNRYALTLMEIAHRRQPQGADWRERLYEITCMIPFSRRAAGAQQGWETRNAGCARALWLGREGEELTRGQVPFARTYLRLNAVDNLYADYYQSALGGNRGFMPLLGLAQSYARIVSDRQVAARMSGGSLPTAPTLGQKDAVWKALMDGMWGTIARPGGTGRASLGPLARRMGSGRRGYFLLAKTGTPTVELREVDGATRRVDGNTLVLVAIRSRTGGVPRRASDLCAARILAANFQYREPGRIAPSARLAELLAASPAFRTWLDAPCG